LSLSALELFKELELELGEGEVEVEMEELRLDLSAEMLLSVLDLSVGDGP
jgi:hypothetical protein